MNGGYNYCPTNTVMGGWWKADNSSYCGGPRYYMDCNATCQCSTGCGNGWGFCEPGCDGVTCGCGPNGCNSYVTGCFQFRYGQCNQQVDCIGRIVCRVVACVPPWEIDPTCTTTNAQDNSTAEQNAACWTPAFPSPNPGPCASPLTNCQVVGMAPSPDGAGYGIVTSFGRMLPYGDFPNDGDESGVALSQPMVGIGPRRSGGYYLVASDGGIFSFAAPFFGSMGGQHLNQPMVGMAVTPAATATGRWPPTAASSPSATPSSSAPWAASTSTSPSWAWPPPRPAGATGAWPPTAASSPSATPSSSAPWAASTSTSPSWAWPPPRRAGATGAWPPTAGIFSFGDAQFFGSMGGQHLNQPIVGMAAPPATQGYWLVAGDGGIFTFNTPFYGSAA